MQYILYFNDYQVIFHYYVLAHVNGWLVILGNQFLCHYFFKDISQAKVKVEEAKMQLVCFPQLNIE